MPLRKGLAPVEADAASRVIEQAFDSLGPSVATGHARRERFGEEASKSTNMGSLSSVPIGWLWSKSKPVPRAPPGASAHSRRLGRRSRARDGHTCRRQGRWLLGRPEMAGGSWRKPRAATPRHARDGKRSWRALARFLLFLAFSNSAKRANGQGKSRAGCGLRGHFGLFGR